MIFGHVPPPILGGVWRDTVQLLSRAMKRGGNDWQELADSLDSGHSQLWLTEVNGEPVAAMVTRIDGDTLEVWLAGGAVLTTSVPFLETAIEASREVGTTNGRIIGRKGWARVLRPYGWRIDGEELVKDW